MQKIFVLMPVINWGSFMPISISLLEHFLHIFTAHGVKVKKKRKSSLTTY